MNNFNKAKEEGIEKFSKAPIRHLSLHENTELDGVVWVSKQDVIGFLSTFADTIQKADREDVVEEIKRLRKEADCGQNPDYPKDQCTPTCGANNVIDKVLALLQKGEE